MAKAKQSKAGNFRRTESVPTFTAASPHQAATITFERFIHGQVLPLPFTLEEFTFASPFNPNPLKVIDMTVFPEPSLENTWLTVGVALRPDGVFVQFAEPTDLCTVSFVPAADATALQQVRIEWFDSSGNLIDQREYGPADPLPQYKAFTHVISAKDVLTVGVYSDEETPLCRVQALFP